MAKYEKKPEPGDLIEISRGLYQHWAIYVGEGYVIHLTRTSEHAQASASSLMSVHERAIVKKEEFYEVVGDYKYRINNLLDEKYKPRPVQEILRDADRLLGQEFPYCVVTRNCEHFVTELRYGKPESRQVRVAVLTLAVVGGWIGLVIIAFAASKCLTKKTKTKTSRHNEL